MLRGSDYSRLPSSKPLAFLSLAPEAQPSSLALLPQMFSQNSSSDVCTRSSYSSANHYLIRLLNASSALTILVLTLSTFLFLKPPLPPFLHSCIPGQPLPYLFFLRHEHVLHYQGLVGAFHNDDLASLDLRRSTISLSPTSSRPCTITLLLGLPYPSSKTSFSTIRILLQHYILSIC